LHVGWHLLRRVLRHRRCLVDGARTSKCAVAGAVPRARVHAAVVFRQYGGPVRLRPVRVALNERDPFVRCRALQSQRDHCKVLLAAWDIAAGAGAAPAPVRQLLSSGFQHELLLDFCAVISHTNGVPRPDQPIVRRGSPARRQARVNRRSTVRDRTRSFLLKPQRKLYSAELLAALAYSERHRPAPTKVLCIRRVPQSLASKRNLSNALDKTVSLSHE
jgi:hypothetical protein